MQATVHDPVCHMDIAPANAAGTSEYEGSNYYFCSNGCKKDFERDPEGTLKAEAEYDHSKGADMMMGEPKRPSWQFWKR